jgi:glycosyltransferase involved in cell wall biosynthesis
MHNPIFSIVIPTYNHAHLLNRCIDSLLAQTYPNWEAIIVNNYSEDNTIEVVEKYADSRIKLVNFHNNGIIGAARNEGIRNATGGFVAFLDSDDWWKPEKLAAIEAHTASYDVIYHDLEIVFHDKGPRIKKTLRPRHLKAPVYRDLLLNGNCIPNSAAAIKRSVLLEAGGLDENKELVAVEDYDLWVRIAKTTDRFIYIPSALGYYWIGGSNTTQASQKQINRYEAFYAKHLPDLEKQDAAVFMAMKNYNLGRIHEKMGNYREAIALYKHALQFGNYTVKFKSFLLILLCRFK